ncbi:MAG TPA: hypothetical protein VEK08_26935 [Planctomycetota bacterium]|nr:hypothetical protein [Planctomycetota bacterium]
MPEHKMKVWRASNSRVKNQPAKVAADAGEFPAEPSYGCLATSLVVFALSAFVIRDTTEAAIPLFILSLVGFWMFSKTLKPVSARIIRERVLLNAITFDYDTDDDEEPAYSKDNPAPVTLQHLLSIMTQLQTRVLERQPIQVDCFTGRFESDVTDIQANEDELSGIISLFGYKKLWTYGVTFDSESGYWHVDEWF